MLAQVSAATQSRASLYILDGDHDINHEKHGQRSHSDYAIDKKHGYSFAISSFITPSIRSPTISPMNVPEECSKMVID